ncbi:MAG TPA: aminotransferase class III-fold pyridoxal phosphate-dependent enzyme [Thermoanaerobaculia bacterium]|jgi:taurine--2-oxoglutarate transaminase|nr:aminotransferase class III-fold pyridoxal phosphate-dependent enzyme [Thermoanaerobaculia bacterium]
MTATAETTGAMTAEEIVSLTKRHTIFSWSAQGSVNPIPMVRGEGIYFWDANGKRYMDMNSQLMCVNIGHGDRRVIDAIKRQAEELAYAGPGMATPVRARVGKMLADLTPGDLNRFFFTLGGAEANENAIRVARMVTGRQKIMVRYRSYHGATAGAISLTGDPRRWANEPGLPGVVRFFDPYKYRSHLFREGDSDEMFTRRCLDEIEETLMYEGPQTIAAIFIETVTGTNGLIVPPDGYLQGLRQICDRHGILLVCDEVMCGLGRTGKWFAADHWNVVPDMITMAKGLTSAYLPLGALALSDRLANYFDKNIFFGGLTYNAHPMSLAAAEACLQAMIDDDTMVHTQKMGRVLRDLHGAMKDKHPSVGDVRSIGLFGVLELVRNRATKEPMAPFNGTSPEMQKLGAFLKENGMYAFINWNNLFTNPPLCITESQLREAFELIDRGLEITDAAVTQ